MTSLFKKHRILLLWLTHTAGLAGYLYYLFYHSPDKTALLPGRTTDAHHQIEMECAACHTNEKVENIFTSSGVTNDSCNKCHAEDLAAFSDSHPTRKFKNPENAIFIDHIDALNCITCHSEHNAKITGKMAVSLPPDYCAHCHDVTLQTLDSHKDLTFDTCATAGCHNYHDNISLEPSFLLKHFDDTDLLPKQNILTTSPKPCPDPWNPSTTSQSCASCHDTEMTDFKKGKHGMRFAFEHLSPMTPALARLPMKASAAHREMDCRACHQPEQKSKPHFASQDSCLQCHDDDHSQNHKLSSHFNLGVTCASCHMPREEREGTIIVNHDNTANLRPNEKMIKNVCLDCHGLQFSMNAMTDPLLIKSNFSSPPTQSHPGIKWTTNATLKRGGEDAERIQKYLEILRKKSPSATESQHQK
jgi:hypothetical protein